MFKILCIKILQLYFAYYFIPQEPNIFRTEYLEFLPNI